MIRPFFVTFVGHKNLLVHYQGSKYLVTKWRNMCGEYGIWNECCIWNL